ncbi:RNA-directed DNA polymerase, eukaryota [Tanacetum coccineum]
MSRLSSWDDVVAKLSARLSKWKLKSLSIGGRLTLIKSVLSSLPLYYMSSFKVPKGVLSKMESIRRNFFNGVENAEKKMSLIGWNKILASKKSGESGYGEANSFWNDVWLGDFPLKQTYLRLYFLELDKHFFGATSLVKSTREFIDDFMLPKTDVPTRWIKYIPIKINNFAWRVSLDKLPTRLNISLRGLDIPSIICPLCSITVELNSHLLFSCQLALSVNNMVVSFFVGIRVSRLLLIRELASLVQKSQSFQAAQGGA